MHKRLPKFERQPDAAQKRQVTARTLQIILLLARYRFLPRSLIVQLIPGDIRTTDDHLRVAFDKDLVSRLTFPRVVGPLGEFIYFIDNPAALRLVEEAGLATNLDYEVVRNNREKRYARAAALVGDEDGVGALLFLKHELMISRFHAAVELACRQSRGTVVLETWKQGSELYDRVKVPKPDGRGQQAMFGDGGAAEYITVRPDAFFTFYFPGQPEGHNRAHFFYEADRKTSTAVRFRTKLRGYFHYIVKQRRHEAKYGIKRARAVLIESLDVPWVETLKAVGRDPLVVGPKPSELFWFTHSGTFNSGVPNGKGRPEPHFVLRPAVMFERIWSTTEHKLLSLLD